ncbi:MAG: esterase-like activity of phytase family protein [Erythrobacter sp.]
MRPKRLILAAALALALAPGIWVRSPPLPRALQPGVTLTPIAAQRSTTGDFTLLSAWELTGDPLRFGGFSALVALPGGRFLAGSDTGRRLDFYRPDQSRQPGMFGPFERGEASYKKGRDLESLAVDPESGTAWAGYEYRNSIVRLGPEYRPEQSVRPTAMADWGANSGAESLVRLEDGRFLVIEERPRRWRGSRHRAVLFTGDPVGDTQSQSVLVDIPAGYRPVDAAAAGAGRALVLLRRLDWSIPPGFETAIAELDVDLRDADGVVTARMLAEFGSAIPRDNYEGLAITDDADGQHVWLISDDNFMSYQRTLLLKFRWQQREKARE